MRDEAHILLEIHLRELGQPFMPEYKFCPTRNWRFDYRLIIPWMVAVEIEGGIFSRGRHTRGAGYQKDLLKYNTAAALGWKVYRFSTEDVLKGRAKTFLEEHLKP